MSVILFTGERGSLSTGGSLSSGVLCPGGCLSMGGLCHGHARYSERAGNMHPTGMHSCYTCKYFRKVLFQYACTVREENIKEWQSSLTIRFFIHSNSANSMKPLVHELRLIEVLLSHMCVVPTSNEKSFAQELFKFYLLVYIWNWSD